MTRPWTVLSPGPLTRVDDGLWCVTDAVPGLPGATRRMTIVRLHDGGLLFYNAIPLPDAQLAEVRALGRPAALLVPCAFHCVDGGAFAAKLGVPSFTPAAGLETVRARIVDVRPVTELPLDSALELRTVDGFVTHEACLVVRRADAASLLCADVFTNAPHAGGFPGWGMRLFGFTGPEPKLPPVVRRRQLRDAAQVKRFFDEAAAVPGLRRLIPTHGEVFEQGAADALRAIASTL